MAETEFTPVMDAPTMDGSVTKAKSETSTPVTGSEKVTVKLTFVAPVGFASARTIDKTVGGESTTRSNAPTSGAVPENWSLIPGIATPLSIFGLDD